MARKILWSNYPVQDLKEELKKRDLPVSGNKGVLIERLESSEQLSCDSCGKKFKSRNKLFNHLEEFPDHALENSSREKNYLDLPVPEWAPDAKDANLIEQIKAKYRAPHYKSPPKPEKQAYPLKLSIAIIVLCLIVICTMFLILYGPEPEGTEFRIPCLIIFLLFLILYGYVRTENNKMDLSSKDIPPVVNYISLIGLLMVIPALYFAYRVGDSGEVGWEAELTCCGSLILILIPLSLFSTGTADEILKESEEREKYDKSRWEVAQKHEEFSQFDTAMGIWSELGEEGEIERIAKLNIECLCVLLKRKIKNLTELGIVCTQLEEQLATAETASEALLTIEDSTINQSPDVNQEEHTEESLKEIEEDENNLVKDKTISKPDEEA